MKPTKGIVVDGACSGNPGPGEYRGINLETGEVLFHQKFTRTTNNIMEFCGIVHALKVIKEKRLDLPVWSDSIIAITWINKKETNSALEKTEVTAQMHEFIRRCELWLLNNTKNHVDINKWITAEWDEIPADFGNKNTKKEQKIINDAVLISKNDLREWYEENLKDELLGETGKALLEDLKTNFGL